MASGTIPDVGDVVLGALCTLLVYEFVPLGQGILDEGALGDLDRSRSAGAGAARVLRVYEKAASAWSIGEAQH